MSLKISFIMAWNVAGELHRLKNITVGLMPGTAELSVCSVLLATLENQSMHLPIKVGTDMRQDIKTKALLNSGAGGVFMSHEFAERSGLKTFPLKKLMLVRNIDGTPNKRGMIPCYAKGELKINGRKSKTSFLIAGLGNESVILGLLWLQKINPVIN